ncbi:MAG TPA: hypothetical protein VK171_16185, partial [Fimbriimonas sp.]|nr:hypothetical protein [Fimbriimonas sp.]
MRPISLALFALGAASSALAQSGTFAIVGVRVFVGDGTVIESANVVVTDGKITSVSTEPLASNVLTVDGKGKVLYPGFIDAYSTRLTKSAPEAKVEGKPDHATNAPAFMWIGNRKGIYSDFGAAENLDFEKDASSYENGIATALLAP